MKTSTFLAGGSTFCAAVLLCAACDLIPVKPLDPGTIEILFDDPAEIGTKSAVDVDDYIITVTDASGKSIYSGAFGAAPERIIAAPGTYTVTASSQSFTEPLFDCPVYGDTEVVAVLAGENASVTLYCTQQNSGMKLLYDSSFRSEYPSASLYLKSSEGRLMYGYSEKRTAYFLPGQVSLLLASGGAEKTLFTTRLEPRQMLSVNVSASTPSSPSMGGASGQLSVKVDTSRNWTSYNYSMADAGNPDDIVNSLTVGKAKDNVGAEDVWVCGYIVGGDLSSSKCSFTAPFTSRTNIVIAEKSTCSEKSSCLSVQLSKGDVRDALNLVDNPGNLGRKVYIRGDIVAAYYGIPGVQNISAWQFK